jgi:putative phosphoribosyl transferase
MTYLNGRAPPRVYTARMSSTQVFQNRSDAGRQLAEALRGIAAESPIVYGLPRGGVPVAAEVAAALCAPLDVLIVRKIGMPGQPELALGAICDGEPPFVVWNENLVRQAGLDTRDCAGLAAVQAAEVARRRSRWLGDRPRRSAKGKTAIVVDDGLATGATARAAIHALRAESPRRIVLAAPVAPPQAADEIRGLADDVVILQETDWFPGVGAFYVDFNQVEDEDVTEILRSSEPGQRNAGTKAGRTNGEPRP